MRTLLAAIIAVLTAASAAGAAEAEGKIRNIDRSAMTITLDDGNAYRLPGEFDLEAIEEGMEILLAYEEVDGQKLITDMAFSD